MAATLVKTLSMMIVADPGDSKEVLAALKDDAAELTKPLNLVLTAETGDYQAALDEAAAAQDRFAETQDAMEESLNRLDELERGGAASTDELTEATNASVEASLKAADARKALADANEDLAAKTRLAKDEQVEAGLAMDETSGESGSKLGEFGLIAGAALAGVAYESGKLAVGFQSDMTMIVTQAGVAKSALPGLESGVLKIAGAVGESPDSLAEALYHVESSFASVGIKGPQALNLVEVAAKGAVTGHADLVDVTNALDAAIVSGIPGVQNFGQAMGALNATVGAGDMHMEDLAQAFGTGMLATVKGFGVTLNDVGAALATFGDNNIRGAKAGTELRMAVQALGAPGTGPVAVAALKSLNLSYTTLSDDMQKGGLRLAITDLVKHLKSAGDTGDKTGEILTDAFGKKAGSGVNILVSQIGRFQSKFPDMKKGADDFGKDWQAAAATPAVKLKQLESGGEAAATSLGLVLLPALESVLGPAVSFLNWVDGSKTKMEVFAGVVGVLAGTVLAAKLGGAIKGGVNEFKSLAGMVQTAATKLGILKKSSDDAAGASEKSGAAAKKAGAEQEEASGEAAATAKKDAGETAAANDEAAEESADKYKWMALKQEEASGEAATAAEADAAETAASNEEAAAESSGSWIVAAGRQVAAGAAWVAQSAVKVGAVVAKNAAGAATTLGSWVATGAGQLASGAAWVAESTAKVAVVVAGNVAGAATTAGAWIVANGVMLLGIGLVVALVALAVVEIVRHWKQISDGAKDAFHFVETAADDVFKWVKHNWPLLLAILTGPFGLAVYEIKEHWNTIKTDAMDVVHTIGHWFDMLPGMLFKAGKNALTGLLNGIGSIVSTAESTVGGWGHDIANAIGAPFGLHFSEPSEALQMVKAGHRIGESFAKGITESAGLSASAAMQMERGASAALAGGGGRGGAGGGGDTYIFNIPELSDPMKTARAIQQMLLALKRRNGKAPLGLT